MRVAETTPDANGARPPLQIVGGGFEQKGVKKPERYHVVGFGMSVPPKDTGDVGFWMVKLSRKGSAIRWLVPLAELMDPDCWTRVA